MGDRNERKQEFEGILTVEVPPTICCGIATYLDRKEVGYLFEKFAGKRVLISIQAVPDEMEGV